ncbi:hypothetical protein NCAS_0H02680 [Naumovozyma castellii]|uniref:EamA domain-containing protein n=1 Tax=Naumovozyma castellii TaxID=27288 RepID=G0VJ99_NAUCA|nr:hypothetical protein NCAS_0H02680 [Naumovozyma castellii CBS 4309]CCC71578.1 hypothetical protein NCAS_0H02680 [Naumovozyma castellii CBS 4309]
MIVSFNKKWTLGLVMLVIVIILWVLSSFLINLIFEDDSFRKPFFITYINTSSFIFYLIPTCNSLLGNYKRTGSFNIYQELKLEEEGATNSEPLLHSVPSITLSLGEGSSSRIPNVGSPLIPKPDEPTVSSNTLETSTSNEDSPTDLISLSDTIRLSAQFCILWFLANFVTNASLAYTSVASQTILSSTSSFFTLFIGSLCHVEQINRSKIIGSIISFLGTMLVTKSDANSRHLITHPPMKFDTTITSSGDEDEFDSIQILIGNLLALGGALFYGIYSTLLKRKVKDESRMNMKLFFGFVGLFTLIFLWPTILFLHYQGWETFELPTSPRVILIVMVNCIITFVSDFCWAKAMLLTTPLTVTVGLSMTIPLAMFGDFVFKHKSMSLLYSVGAILILGSFFVINKSSEEEHDNSEHHENTDAIDI